MLAAAEDFARSAAPDRPVFLFLFFFGTHFNYFLDREDEGLTVAAVVRPWAE